MDTPNGRPGLRGVWKELGAGAQGCTHPTALLADGNAGIENDCASLGDREDALRGTRARSGVPLSDGLYAASGNSESVGLESCCLGDGLCGSVRAGEAAGGNLGPSMATCTSEGSELHREGASGSWDACLTGASGRQRGPDSQILELETLWLGAVLAFLVDAGARDGVDEAADEDKFGVKNVGGPRDSAGDGGAGGSRSSQHRVAKFGVELGVGVRELGRAASCACSRRLSRRRASNSASKSSWPLRAEPREAVLDWLVAARDLAAAPPPKVKSERSMRGGDSTLAASMGVSPRSSAGAARAATCVSRGSGRDVSAAPARLERSSA